MSNVSNVSRPGFVRSSARSLTLAMVGPVVLGLGWEAVKAIGGPSGRVLGIRTDDSSMPHISTVLHAFGKEDVRGTGRSVFDAVVAGSWYSLRLALGGFVVGSIIGVLLAMSMQRFRVVERAWLPYVVLSQTVPLIALAPLIVGWGGRIKVFGHAWEPWMTVVGMAAYLSFFPVAIGALRGFQSPKVHSLELMDSFASSWWQTLTKLRLPASVPYLMPAFKLGASASVVGAIVSEISTGTPGGIGRLIIDYFQKATGDPSRVFTAFTGAAALGLVVAGLVGLLERVLTRHHPKEQLS
jgi:NitT/TauT family transport system permease protein